MDNNINQNPAVLPTGAQHPTVKFGLHAAALTIIGMLGMWFIFMRGDVPQEPSGIITALQTILVLFLIIYPAILARRAMGGYISFWDSVKTILIAAGCAVIAALITSYILHHLLDPTLGDRNEEFAIEKMYEAGEAQGQDESTTDATVKMMQGWGILRGEFGLWLLVGSLFFYFIVAAIASLFIRKNPPMFATPEQMAANQGYNQPNQPNPNQPNQYNQPADPHNGPYMAPNTSTPQHPDGSHRATTDDLRPHPGIDLNKHDDPNANNDQNQARS